MRALIVGLGQVGAATAWLYKQAGWEVDGYDIDPEIRKRPFPLGDDFGVLSINVPKKLRSDYDSVAICVPTPVDDMGHNTSIVQQAYLAHAKRGKWIVIRSTLPVLACLEHEWRNTIYIPEIRPVGSMLRMWPLVLIGANLTYPPPHDIIEPYIREAYPLMAGEMTIEFAKLALNVYLACSITIANTLEEAAALYGVDFSTIERILKHDPRIGKAAFVKAGLGFGGSCLPKDLKGFAYATEQALLSILLEQNDAHLENIVQRIATRLGGLEKKHICILGLAFKPNTDCLTDSRSVALSELLVEAGAYVTEHDPYVDRPGVFNCALDMLAGRGYDLYILATPHPEYFGFWESLPEDRKFCPWSNPWGTV